MQGCKEEGTPFSLPVTSSSLHVTLVLGSLSSRYKRALSRAV